MTTNVIMPVLGMVQDTGTIVRWLKSLGDTVSQGEILLEVETDKAVQELEAPASGILAQILAHEGDVVPVTQVVAVILTPEEVRSAPGLNKIGALLPAGIGALPAEPLTPTPQVPSLQASRAVNTTPEPRSGRILASPKARRLAQEMHQNLALLQGSGPDGAVLAQDVESYAAQAPVLKIPSLAEISHLGTSSKLIDLNYTARADQFLAWQAVLQKALPQEITTTDLLVLIASRALLKHPKINATWQDGSIKLFDEINISLGVAVENGMVWPVIHQADRLSLSEIANERQVLVARAQSGKLHPADVTGGTFTISNLGMYRVDAYKATLNAPQAAILAVGRIAEQVIPLKGVPSIQPVMNLSLSLDQRVIGDSDGARFLETLAEMIEEPLMLLT